MTIPNYINQSNPRRRALTGGGAVEINSVCPTITPTLGLEDIANGNMEAGDPPNNWTAGGSAVLDGVADERTGGSGVQSLAIVNGATSSGRAQQALDNGDGVWMYITFWRRRVVNAEPTVRLYTSGFVSLAANATPAGTSWVSGVLTGRLSGSGCILTCSNSASALNDETRLDDVSGKPITFSTMFSLLGARSQLNGSYWCNPTVAIGTQCGFAIGDITTPKILVAQVAPGLGVAKLEQLNGSTWTLLRSGSITYGATKVIGVYIDGITAKLYYDGAQVGADATITAVPTAFNVYGFSSYSGNSVGTVQTATGLNF